MTYHQRHFFEKYQQEGGEVDYSTFISVLSRFNQLAVGKMLEGYDFPMGKDLSRLSIVRVKRDFSHKLSVDWNASYALKQEIIDAGETPRDKDHPDGEEWLVYFTDDWYCRFFWEKSTCKVKHRMYYRFDPTRGAKGNKTRLKNLLRSDDLAHLRFRLVGDS